MTPTHTRVQKSTWLVFLVIALLFPARLFAVPARSVVETLEQPDGSVISVRQFGDEWNNGHRTLDGYTIVRDQRTRFWMYAEQGPAAGLRPSPFIVGRDRPVGIRRLLRAQRASAQNGSLSQPAVQGPSAATNLGGQPLLIIFVDFTPSARVGSAAASLASKFFGASSSVKHSYEQVSYGNFSTTRRRKPTCPWAA